MEKKVISNFPVNAVKKKEQDSLDLQGPTFAWALLAQLSDTTGTDLEHVRAFRKNRS